MGVLVEFTPRYFPTIIQDAVSYMRIVAPELTDYEIGSRIRTILEAIASEQDEEYHQMTALSLLQDLDNNFGRDLDERLALRNVTRQRATFAVGEVVISNNGLTTGFLNADIPAGSVVSELYSTNPFPDQNFPYTIRIGEGTANVEDVTLSGNNKPNGQLTHTATLAAHSRDERVSLVEGGVLSATPGTRVRVRAAPDSPIELTATLLEQADIQPGDFNSNSVLARADTPGEIGRFTKGAVRSFVGSLPFDGALVRNDAPFGGGRDDESDEQYRSRGRQRPQALARSITTALRELVVGFTFLDENGQEFRVVSANTREQFRADCDDLVYLYIWPGTFGFVDQRQFNPSGLDADAEVLTASAEEGATYFRLANYPVVPGTFIVQLQPVGTTGFTTITAGTDYYFNETTGWLEYVGGLSAGDALRVLRYDYYRGLIQRVQEFVNGSLVDKVNLPGVRAGGVKVLVTFPRPKKILDIRAGISVVDGRESEVGPLVQDEISRYLSGLAVGDDVIQAELVERAMSVPNMFNIKFTFPTDDIVIQQDQILDLEDVDIVIS